MPSLPSFIARHPRRALLFGKAFILAGGILVLGAVFARIGLADLNAQRAEASLPLLRTLAEAWPQYPTWVVPEGPVGFAIAGGLVLVGMALVVLAEKAPGGARRR